MIQKFDYTERSNDKYSEFDCTLAKEGCHSDDDCHYKPIWCSCRGDKYLFYKQEEQDTKSSKETAYANTKENTAWQGCNWKVVEYLGIGVLAKKPILIGGKLWGPYPAKVTSHINQQLTERRRRITTHSPRIQINDYNSQKYCNVGISLSTHNPPKTFVAHEMFVWDLRPLQCRISTIN